MSSSSSARGRRLGAAAVLAGAALGLAPAPVPAAAPGVSVSVVGPGGAVVRSPRGVVARAARLRVGGRACVVPDATPLAALAQLRLPLRVTAGGSCSPSALFLTAIGRRVNAGRNGWAYKVGRRAGTAGAGSSSGSFGSGRLRGGEAVTWFWCVLGARGCQRTLVASRVGAATVRVMGYDDLGRGVRIRSALVRVTDARGRRVRGRTGRRGTVRFGGLRGAWRISAKRGGLVPALPGGAR